MVRRSARWHTIYSLISTIIEEGAIAAGLLWLAPILGFIMPVWGVISIMVVFAVFSYFMYRVGHPTISCTEMNAPESIVGSMGIVESELNPEGYVKVFGELWRATCVNTKVKKGEEITVTGIDGLRLTVEKKA